MSVQRKMTVLSAMAAAVAAAGAFAAGPAGAQSYVSAETQERERLLEQARVRTSGGLTIEYSKPGNTDSVSSSFARPEVWIPPQNRQAADRKAD